MSIDEFRLRPMLVGEVAKAAKVPRETLRTWLRQEFFGVVREKGWKRFTDFETVMICVFSEFLRRTKDHELAKVGYLMASEALITEWNEAADGSVAFAMSSLMQDRFMFFWRGAGDEWGAKISEGPEDSIQITNELIDGSYKSAPIFTVINIGSILRQVFVDIIDVQVETEREQK